MKSPSAIVIGAGIGGIATAAHLARRGMQVTVVEKNQRRTFELPTHTTVVGSELINDLGVPVGHRCTP